MVSIDGYVGTYDLVDALEVTSPALAAAVVALGVPALLDKALEAAHHAGL